MSTEVVIAKAKKGNSYADILRRIKSDLNKQRMSVIVTKIRRNVAGNLLVELKKQAATT